MAGTIAILGNKQEAQCLVEALQQESDRGLEEWLGEGATRADIVGLVVSGCSCSSPSSLAAVFSLRGLCTLTLSFNGIVELPLLSGFDQLQFVDISHNKICSLNGLRGMTNLRTLQCNNNQISSLEPLQASSLLSELWIASNNLCWEDLFYLHGNEHLKNIVLFNNPLEKKQKVEEFLIALCCSLETINGVACFRDMNDFLSTTDGRVMVTQARLYSQKEAVSSNPAGLKRTPSSRAIARAGSVKSLLRGTTNDGYPHNIRSTMSAGGESIEGVYDDIHSPQRSEPGVYDGARTFKARRKKKTSGIGQRYINGSTLSAAGEFQISNESESNKFESATPKLDTEKESEDIDVCLHFGAHTSSPKAICLYRNGTGFARYHVLEDIVMYLRNFGLYRWARSGTVACSFEAGGRLFSSHKSGSLAAVLAADGTGSVMDDMGNSVLTLKSSGEAIVYNAGGEIECSFCRPPLTNHEIGAPVDVLTIYNGAARKKVSKISLRDLCATSEDMIYTYTLQWVFSDLVVEFVPSKWEVI